MSAARSLAQRGTGTQVALEQATRSSSPRTRQASPSRGRRLEKATIVAPFDGVVGLRSVGVGDYVAVGNQPDHPHGHRSDQDRFPRAGNLPRPGKNSKRIEIRVDAIPDRTFSGRIYVIDPVVDVNGRAIRLRATAAKS